MEERKEEFLNNIELPLIANTIVMETTGFTIDKDLLESIKLDLERKVLALDIKYNGINLSSPKQLKEYLTKLGYQKDLTTYLVHGQAQNTNKLTLLKLAQKAPVARDILDYREAKKLLSTYVTPMYGHDKWIGNFNQTGTITGRYSSSKPNLQNIPNRSQQGRMIRKCLTAAPGYRLIVSDFSQIEPRLYAFFSKDKKLCDIFRTGKDFHTEVTNSIYGTNIPTKDQRFVGKTVDLATLYGARTPRLRQELFKYGVDMPYIKVNNIRNSIVRTYHGAVAWADKINSTAPRIGYVETLLGRRIPLSRGDNPVNMKIQGSCADVLKVAILNLYRSGYRIIATVHDEIIIECIGLDADVRNVKYIMENSVRLAGIPLVAETSVRTSWVN